MHRNSENVSTKQQRIAELVKRSPEMAFTSLAYLMDIAWLHEAYRRTRKDGAVGIDGVTARAYEADLEANLQSLLDRAKSGSYRAPAVRRVHIPKGGSKTETRPIGIPTLEDKVLQRAVLMLLEPIYEVDFHEFSYGFRPGRSAHMAIDATWRHAMDLGGGWILEVDLRKFFDTLDHGHLRAFLQQRVRDGVLKRLIGKWLNAGVMEHGSVSYPGSGSPQGGVISPLAANVYLHYVLDDWFEHDVKPRLRGQAYLVRYADDFAIVFEHEEDARRVMAVLPKRCDKYGLTVHPDKTRLIDFRRPDNRPADTLSKDRGDGASHSDCHTFDLLGFTHYWGRSRRGTWVVKRKTASKRLTRAVQNVGRWCRANRHEPITVQHAKLSRKITGHYAYYGITGNGPWLRSFLYLVHRAWHRWLNRRHRKRTMNWQKFNRLLERYPLPPIRVVHSVYARAANP
jgi:group II intron reverse transcriptase/maturase